MELFTNNYTEHNVIGGVIYLYITNPRVESDPIIGNLSEPHSDLRFAHNDASSDIISSIFEENLIFSLLLIILFILLISIILTFIYYNRILRYNS